MVGRALRTAPGKRRGLVLDHAGNSLLHGLYDFPHQWSLEGRPKKPAEPLARQCPECGAVMPIRSETCPECGFAFVVQLRPSRVPVTAEGDFEPVDDDGVNDEQVRRMPYHQLLAWCEDNPLRLRRARLLRRKADGSRYRKGWEWHTAAAWRAAQAFRTEM